LAEFIAKFDNIFFFISSINGTNFLPLDVDFYWNVLPLTGVIVSVIFMQAISVDRFLAVAFPILFVSFFSFKLIGNYGSLMNKISLNLLFSHKTWKIYLESSKILI